MQGKTCFKCDTFKPLDDFYAHKVMADGHLNKCKECTKRDVKANYEGNREAKSEYERRRARTPARRAKKAVYVANHRRNNPEKTAARTAVGNAIRDGRIVRQPCETCGSQDVQAHHDDYSRPLDVRWLCFFHHRVTHGQKPVLSPF